MAENVQKTVISLGGSLVIPDGLDIDFLARFTSLIREYARERQFVIVVGGGKVARDYQEAARAVEELTDEDADWLGIHCTRLNAHLLRTLFKAVAHPRVFSSPEDVVPFNEAVAIGAGWRPGWSTDYVAASIAEKIGISSVVNLSNTEYVYSADPKKDSSARPLKDVSWADYRALIPSEWVPGLNTPFDPIASKKAQELGLTVAIMNGKGLDNLKKYLDGEAFDGTLIH